MSDSFRLPARTLEPTLRRIAALVSRWQLMTGLERVVQR
jgi:hypothetical protein